MNRKTEIAFGALLHDIGKVVIRGESEQGTHSELGAKFIRDEVAASSELWTPGIIEQIRFHHAADLAKAEIAENSPAYITYFADNISAAMDRKQEGEDAGFDKKAKLRKIFNILGGEHDDNTLDLPDYNEMRESIKAGLKRIEVSDSSIGSLLNLLEATTGRIPSSTNKAELIDISLYDHVKTTAAIAACIQDYLVSAGVENYKDVLFSQTESEKYYEEKMFLLFSCDMSGIQNFIYNISGSGALKQLRARSFYLEIMLEHIADELLSRLGISRANLLYTGGGHAYMLLPNTAHTKQELAKFGAELKAWFLTNFKTELYIAEAYEACSGNDLANRSDDKKRYRRLYQRLSEKLSAAKMNRYSEEELRALNFSADEVSDHSRECKECHRSDMDTENGICPLCASFAEISKDLVRKDVFVVGSEGVLSLPFGKKLSVLARKDYVKTAPSADRVYTKNDWDTGIDLSTHIWMGDYEYPSASGIGGYAGDSAVIGMADTGDKSDTGIERLGVMRADVDNLGSVFTHGLPDDKISISRTSTLSRELSYFFKYHINKVFEEKKYRAQVIYAGGDDVFVIGNWLDVIYAALDIKNALIEFTGNGSLTISAGIGMYADKYPIARMAEEVGMLESAAKDYKNEPRAAAPSKNAVALWADTCVMSWENLEKSVMDEKLTFIKQAFKDNEKGKAFIYRLLALLRDDSQIAVSRLAYLLARSFEGSGGGTKISERFYDWAMDEKQRRHLVTALEIYVYSTRKW